MAPPGHPTSSTEDRTGLSLCLARMEAQSSFFCLLRLNLSRKMVWLPPTTRRMLPLEGARNRGSRRRGRGRGILVGQGTARRSLVTRQGILLLPSSSYLTGKSSHTHIGRRGQTRHLHGK